MHHLSLLGRSWLNCGIRVHRCKLRHIGDIYRSIGVSPGINTLFTIIYSHIHNPRFMVYNFLCAPVKTLRPLGQFAQIAAALCGFQSDFIYSFRIGSCQRHFKLSVKPVIVNLFKQLPRSLPLKRDAVFLPIRIDIFYRITRTIRIRRNRMIPVCQIY